MIENRRLTDVKENDLILYVPNRGTNKGVISPYLIVVDNIEFFKGVAFFIPRNPAYILFETSSFPSDIGIEVSTHVYKILYENKMSTYRIGKKDILDYVNENGLERHSSWIEELPENLVSLPKCKTVLYIARNSS